MMTSGVDGLLIPAKDKKALKDAIRKLLEDSCVQEKLGVNARKQVEEYYDIGKSVQRLVNIYSNI